MSLENLRNKIKKVSKPVEAERLPAPNLARACENPKIDVPDKKENQATKLSKVIQTLMEILTDEDLQAWPKFTAARFTQINGIGWMRARIRRPAAQEVIGR